MARGLEPTRLYVRSGGQLARLLWVRNHRPNEMLLGFYGLNGAPAQVVREFPERRIGPGDSGPFSFKWTDATTVAIPLDHFSCHADGRFHLKRQGGHVLYSHNERHATPLGPDSDVFLDLIVVSGPIQSYAPIAEEPRFPLVYVEGPPEATITLKCLFVGINHPVEPRALAVAASRGRPTAVLSLVSSTIKGVLVSSIFPISAEAVLAHPGGTLAIFRWAREGRLAGYKGFVLA
jgi:hypothetical protein